MILTIVGNLTLGNLPAFARTSDAKVFYDSVNQALAPSQKISFGPGCDGRSDYPHISVHVPRTVNVVALTECPGRMVTLVMTLSRKGWWIFRESRTVSKRGFERVLGNVALACKWKKGQAKIEYIVSSVHGDDSGEIARTRLHAFIAC